jgi:DNA (cytosine-5)-methyltransferase 1
VKKIKVFSVCSGAGGIELALDRSKFEIAGHAETDRYASAVLRHHYPKVKNYGNIDQEGLTKSLPQFDLLTGGTPCQSFSVANADRATGLEGKSGLFYSFVKILKERNPDYFLWENVPNAPSVNSGVDFLIIQNLLAEAGYSIQWQILDSKYFGASQSRSRLYVFGYSRKAQSPNEVFYNQTDSDGPFAKILRSRQGNYQTISSGIKDKPRLVAYSKSTRQNHIDHRIRVDGQSHTLTTGFGCTSQSSFNYVMNRGKIRHLTPLEAERLMTWPDDWTKYGTDENGRVIELSDNQRYKLCGNGVVSLVAKQIIEGALL